MVLSKVATALRAPGRVDLPTVQVGARWCISPVSQDPDLIRLSRCCFVSLGAGTVAVAGADDGRTR